MDTNSQHYPHEEYYQKNSFATAALILGGFAILGTTTILPAIFAGSLSILFGILSRKRRKKLSGAAKGGMICSAISIGISSVMFISYTIQLPVLLKDENFRQQIETTYEQIYGQSIEESDFNILDYMENLAGTKDTAE